MPKGESKPALIMSFDPDTSLILAAYQTNDEVGKVLRAHLIVEQQLEMLIKLFSTAKVDKKTSFWVKVNLLRAMGVPEKVCAACDELNELRNAFAHNAKANIANTKDISEQFLDAVEAFFPKLRQTHGVLNNARSRTAHAINFEEADQGQRIVLASAFLSSLIGVLPKLYRLGTPMKIRELSGLAI